MEPEKNLPAKEAVENETIQLQFFIRPTIVGCCASLLWYFIFHKNDWHIPEGDEAILWGTLSFLGIWHAIVTGLIFTKVWDEFVKFLDCIYEGKREEFVRMLRYRIPLVLRTFLLVLSVMIQCLFSLLNFSTAWVGFLITFCIGLMLVMFWEVAYNLDNPVKAVWYKTLIPVEWFFKQ